MHAGGLRHCGVPVAQGVRYQLVLFLLSTDHPDVAGRLQAIGAAAGAKAAQGARAPLDIALSTAALSTRSMARAFLTVADASRATSTGPRAPLSERPR